MKEFATQSSYPMIPLSEAWQRVEAIIERLPAIDVALEDALSHVLAEDVHAAEDMPPFPASRMDGYAVRADDGSPRRRVLGEGIAGALSNAKVEPGTAMRIMTGAPLPPGADAVIPVEETEEEDGYVQLPGAVPSAQYVRPRGLDYERGDLILSKDSVIGPPEIGLLANLGQTTVSVYPRPRVAILATGDELVGPEQRPGPGQIRDSNSYALAAAVRQAGGIVAQRTQIIDQVENLRQGILATAEVADVVLTSGGVSMGTRDLLKPILEELGEVHFGRVAIKPGKPLTLATIAGAGRDTVVLGLPGFPVSSLVCFENVVRPAMRLMAGHKAIWRPEITVRLRHAVAHKPARTEFQRAVAEQEDGQWWAATTGSQVSSRLLSLVGANVLLRIPKGTGDVAAGNELQAIRIDLPEEAL